VSQGNLEVVRSIWSAWERGEYDSIHWEDSEIEFVMADGPTPGRWRGAAGITEGWGGFLSAWEGFRAKGGEYHELDDERVLVISSFAGRGKASGISLEETGGKGATILHVRGARVTKLIVYFELAHALTDLGLSSQAELAGLDSRSEALEAAGMPARAGNVEAARRVLAAVAERNLDELLELTDPDVEWQSFFALGQGGGVYRGHDAMPRYLHDLVEAFDWLRPQAADFLDVGDVVVGVGRNHYRGRGSGVEGAAPAGWVFRFRGGRLLGFRAFPDPEAALEAVGRPG
jgi:ketosteroid isomerase-like protein